VIGMTVAQATTTLQGAGLKVVGVTGNPTGTTQGTQPATNAVVPTGSSVTILAQ
jgi:beta-lactam-binding protein with PASTA domain